MTEVNGDYFTPNMTIQIKVKAVNGQITPYDVKPGDTVLQLKKLIQEKQNVQINEQRLVFHCKNLEDS